MLLVPRHDVGPELVGAAGAREDAGHADDGDVERGCAAGWTVGGRPRARRAASSSTSTLPALTSCVQLGDGGDAGAQGGDLADHEHALAGLRGVVDLDQLVARALDALAGDAEAAQVELLQVGPHRLAVGPGAPAARPCARRRCARSRSRRTGWRGPGAVSSSTVRSQPEATDWKRGGDGAPGHGLLGEQVGGAHQHPDVGAPGGQRCRRRRDHGGRAWRRGCRRPAGSRAPRAGRRRAAARSGSPRGGSWPAGPTWPPHSRALEHEAAGALLQEAVEQPGGGHVEVGGDARPPRGARPARGGRRR